MKNLRVLAIAAAVLATGTAMANDQVVVTDEGVGSFSFFKPYGVRIEAGTTGYGGALVYSASQNTDLVIGYNGGDISYSNDLSIDGVKYDLEQENNTSYLNAQLRPFANSFHVALGVAYTDNEYMVTGRPTSNGNESSYRIDGKTFQADTIGTLTGKVKYKNDIVPYVGIGFSPAITTRFGLFGQVGAYYTGNPEVTLVGSSVEARTPGTEQNTAIANERRKIQNEDKFEFQPVAKLGATLRF